MTEPWAKPSGGVFDLRGDAVPEATDERRPGDDAECERLGCEDKTHPVWHLVPAVTVDVHEPGDPHQYRITCKVCGMPGTIRLSVDPETGEP